MNQRAEVEGWIRIAAAVILAAGCGAAGPAGPAGPAERSLPGAPSPAENFGADLVGWWQLDEGSGTLAGDASGLGNNGTLVGAAAFTSDALLGTAVDLTAQSGRVDVPHHASLEPPVGTIEVWIKVAALQNTDVVAKTTDCRVRTDPMCLVPTGISVIGLRIQEDGGANAFIANDDPTTPGAPWRTALSGPGLITPGEWHHLAMRWDGSEIALFVDG
ncbi:MAG: LamG-like jellyroll fold domain-containing protein, partial [Gemmatimonadota bacterium]